MRSPKSRSRNKSNRNRNNPGNIINRVFDSSGPDGKVRGTPQQIIDKYSQLARDAFLSNDRVAGENFQQHAEHYTRLLAEAQREVENRRQQAEQQNRERQQKEKEERERKAEAAAQAAGAAMDMSAEGAEQPDLIDPAPENGLVETPESKPKKAPAKPRRPRKAAKPKAEPESAAETPGAAEAEQPSDTPDAAE